MLADVLLWILDSPLVSRKTVCRVVTFFAFEAWLATLFSAMDVVDVCISPMTVAKVVLVDSTLKLQETHCF